MRTERVGFAVCGSFCTHEKVLEALARLTEEYETVIPIVSEISAFTDTRFGTSEDLLEQLEDLTGNEVLYSIPAVEPIGPKGLLDVLVVAPATGNTIAKLAAGITDTVVTMAVKAHLRNSRPVVIAVSSNDGLAAGAKNIGELLVRKNYYFVPFGQDNAEKKPASLVSDFSKLSETVGAALQGRQLQPILLREA
ncbi:MAG: dipicolinate synthase subunit B [Oscillibacter sp.]|jgi:dipicolinate synthase subunit B|nr:dipicolinate synthase subunit B [Oscillibacter sp.]